METLINFEVYDSLKNEYDLVDKNYLRDIIVERFEKKKSSISDKHLYSVNLKIIPTRESYHTFCLDKLQEISRKLTNGMNSLGSISNRKFWNENFKGGVRTISMVEENSNDYPTFSLNYLVYSHIDNLDIRILKSLGFRIKMIDPSISFSIKYIGKYSPELLSSNLDYRTKVNYNNPQLKKLGEETNDKIFNNQFQRPRFIGELYKFKS